jgi:Fe2+ or Zn2+ uptake regulation protein
MTIWRDVLRSTGLRVTRPRLAVLAEVDEHPHADVEAIAAGARLRLGSLSTQAVYDVLHVLTDVGLLRRIQPAGSPARFEVQTHDHHHHLVCRTCGAISDAHGATDHALCLQTGGTDFLVEATELTYWGVCPNCQSS